MIINGSNMILGRLATFAAKMALEGELVTILNCDSVVVTGPKKSTIQKFKQKIDMGHPYHGPFYPKLPDRIVKRAIRGMLSYKQERGRKALKRIKCYAGVPENFANAKTENVPNADAMKLRTLNFMTLRNISKYLGKYAD